MYTLSKQENTYYIIGTNEHNQQVCLELSNSSIKKLFKEPSKEILASDHSKTIEDPILDKIVDILYNQQPSRLGVVDSKDLIPFIPIFYEGQSFDRVKCRQNYLDNFR